VEYSACGNTQWRCYHLNFARILTSNASRVSIYKLSKAKFAGKSSGISYFSNSFDTIDLKLRPWAVNSGWLPGFGLQTSCEKKSFAGLWLADTQFPHAGAQRAAVESKDFCSPVLPAYLPMGLLKYPHNIVTLNLIHRFLGGR
jgi:hypothetical protein